MNSPYKIPQATPADIRANAARMVAQVINQGRSLDALFVDTGGSPQERGLTRTLVYGAVRWQIRLEAILTKLISRPTSQLQPDVHALLLIGLFQLLHTDIAPHAAVAETVEAVRRLQQPRAAGLVNAILRRSQREAVALQQEVDQDIALRTAHPQWLVNTLLADWPDDYERLLNANNAHPPMWLRVNRQHTTTEEYLQKLVSAGHDAELSSYSPDAIRLVHPTDVRNLPEFAQGHVSVQDAAAQWAAHLLAPESGMRVLDACAAPGGKTCHLLEMSPDIGELVAVDESSVRMRRVQENLTRLNLQATLCTADVAELDAWWDGRQFERILLDVPCSATGVIRRHPDIKLLRRPTDIAALSERQAYLLETIWPLLAPGGKLLYASCSALRAENASVIRQFLNTHMDVNDVTLQTLSKALPSAAGLRARSARELEDPGIAIVAGDAQMDGFYYACLAKALV